MSIRFQRPRSGDAGLSETMVDRLLDVPTHRMLPPLGRPSRRRRGRWPALLALGGFFVVGIVLVVVALSHGNGSTQAASQPRARPQTHPARHATPAAKKKQARPKRAAAAPIPLQAVGAFDPAGDGHENDSSVSLATDGDLSTSWRTEHYRTWFKPGVGLVLDAGRAVRPTALTLETDNPGFVAEVQAGSSPTGPFTRISSSSTTSDTTVYKLRAPAPVRYILVWITQIPDGEAADVNEVRLR
jgi:hypothetical protein